MTKTILITGCSSGIGLCAAETLQKRGYRVFATARKIQDVERLQSLGLESLLLDMNDSDSIRKAVTEVLAKTDGTLDAVFNNAGYAVPGAVEDLTRDMIRSQFETNVFGPIELTNLIIPVMRKQGYGRIINNTSILGVVAIPLRGAYNASKFALEGFTQTLRQELHYTKIHVSIIAPGPIQTQFRKNAFDVYQHTLENKNSAFKKTYHKMVAALTQLSSGEKAFTQTPDAVVKKLIHALESSAPKARYYVGIPAHIFGFLRRILPQGGLDWVIAKSMREINE